MSAIITKYLGNLKGIEIGRGAHRDYALNAINVDAAFHELFAPEQLKYVSTPAKVDIVAESSAIPLADSTQDFVFSSHVLEHVPDPIATLIEWYRLVHNGGYVAMIVPNRSAAELDRGRPVTTLSELIVAHNMNGFKIKNPIGHVTVWDPFILSSLIEFGQQINLWNFCIRCLQFPDDHTGDGILLVLEVTK